MENKETFVLTFTLTTRNHKELGQTWALLDKPSILVKNMVAGLEKAKERNLEIDMGVFIVRDISDPDPNICFGCAATACILETLNMDAISYLNKQSDIQTLVDHTETFIDKLRSAWFYCFSDDLRKELELLNLKPLTTTHWKSRYQRYLELIPILEKYGM